MDCSCAEDRSSDSFKMKLENKLISMETELVDVAKRILRSATDPFSGVMQFLHERPENTVLYGEVMKKVLHESFGDPDKIPGLVRILAAHVREIIRQSNVINVVNEHPAVERWGNYLIKQKERIAFEVGRDNNTLVLKNIHGLVAVEHGIELPLEKIQVKPPDLIVTVKLGLLRAQKVVGILS